MEIIDLKAEEDKTVPEQVLALGIFDGVHRGHQAVIKETVRAARRRKLPAVVLTLDPHPRSVQGKTAGLKLLTTLKERAFWLERLGIEKLYILPFDEKIARLEPEGFAEEFISRRLNARAVVAGEDYRFGWRCQGDIKTLKRLGQEHGFKATAVRLLRQNGRIISSSMIREFLLEGKLDQTLAWLGHPYLIQGRVLPGHGRGRELGYPTLNLALPQEKMLPPHGVYAGQAMIDGRFLPALLHLGPCPTFGRETVSLEVHLVETDLQDFRPGFLDILICSYIRPIKKFSSPAELSDRIKEDQRYFKDSLSKNVRYNNMLRK